MDPRLLDVLHDPAEEQLGSVVKGIDVDLDGVVEETIDEKRPVPVDASGLTAGALEVVVQSLGVIDDLHTAPAQHIAGAHQDRVANAPGDRSGLLIAQGGAVRRCGQPGALEDDAEGLAVLGGVDGLRARPQDRNPGLG